MKLKIITLIFFFFCLLAYSKDNYNRDSFYYTPYKTKSNIGFYTQKRCKTNIDHVVSLKDAHLSGAYNWNKKLKKNFLMTKKIMFLVVIKLIVQRDLVHLKLF